MKDFDRFNKTYLRLRKVVGRKLAYRIAVNLA